jgi:hypothetical protein
VSASQFLVSVVGTLGSCVGLLLLLYNVMSFALFLREATEGRSSGLARAAWGAGIAAVFLWWMPCVGAAIALGALIASRIERGRIFHGGGAIAGVTPIRLANLNAILVLGLQLLLLVATALAFVSSSLG